MTYLSILPRDLLFELFLYFNYRDTILACQSLPNNICESPLLWIHKIRKELGYSNEFIRDYVYDTDNQTSKTLLPINEKYLELKARTSVDFGTEFYQAYAILLVRSSRLPDIQLAKELTKYLLHITQYVDSPTKKITYGIAIFGFIGRGATDFADKLINEYYQGIPKTIVKDFGSEITSGIYEGYPNGNPELFDHYNVIPDSQYNNIIEGLAAGGHLQQLKNLVIPEIKLLGNAIRLNRKNIVDHYDLINRYDQSIGIITSYGHLYLLPKICNVDKPRQMEILSNFIFDGYLEEIIEYKHLINDEMIKRTVNVCLTNNHIDTVNYLLSLNPKLVKLIITEAFGNLETLGDKYGLDLSTWYYLINNRLIGVHQIKLILSSYISTVMSNIDKDAIDYLSSLDDKL